MVFIIGTFTFRYGSFRCFTALVGTYVVVSAYLVKFFCIEHSFLYFSFIVFAIFFHHTACHHGNVVPSLVETAKIQALAVTHHIHAPTATRLVTLHHVCVYPNFPFLQSFHITISFLLLIQPQTPMHTIARTPPTSKQ